MHAIKWNKRLIQVQLPATSDELKQVLSEQTGVPPDRLSLMCKTAWKGVLQNGVALSELQLPQDALIVMMGTPTSAISDGPKPNVVFLEDLSSSSQAATGKMLPPGLNNLGNTCYLNSTIQLLRKAPELIKAVGQASGTDPAAKLVAKELSALVGEMSRYVDRVTPGAFVTVVRNVFPRFAETTPRGGFVQQDADEFYNELMNALARVTPTSGGSNAVADYFGIKMEIKSKCIENEAEPEMVTEDSMLRLQCTIDASVLHLDAGIKLGLQGVVEKRSELLGRNAQYTQTKRLNKLPKYLVIQMNRFFWKPTPESMDHRGVACKILKQVKFPATLDVYEYCSDALKDALKVARDAKAAAVYADKKTEQSEEEAELQRALAMSMVETQVGVGLPPLFDGRYELVGVVSHKGRASNSGHYMGWTKQDSGKWVCFDDEHPSECSWEGTWWRFFAQS